MIIILNVIKLFDDVLFLSLPVIHSTLNIIKTNILISGSKIIIKDTIIIL